MQLYHKETRIVAFEFNGNNFSGVPNISTVYDYTYKIDNVEEKFAFMINATTTARYERGSAIAFGCFTAFIFEGSSYRPQATKLIEFVDQANQFAREQLNNILVKINNDFEVKDYNEERAFNNLQKMLTGSFREN